MNDLPAGGVEVAPGVRVAASSLRFGVARSGGPGGQNVNKVNTKVELWVAPESLEGLSYAARQRLAVLAGRRLTAAGEIHLSAEEHRSQEQNRSAVMEKLRQLIVAAQYQPKVRRRTRPSAGSVRRRLESKKQRSQTKSQRRRPEP